MTALWDKSDPLEELIYSLPEDLVTSVHPAQHDPLSPRLLCVIKEDSENWETFCLSDFMRSRK